MTERTDIIQVKQFTSKVHRQHSSLVITLPKGICEQLEISKGDIVLFEVEQGEVACVMGKITLRGVDYERDKANSDIKNKGG